jgi:AcrR family transcriptional regulator
VLNSAARERVLDVAEQLFAEEGYASVKLKNLAARLGMAHTSLYHHVPGGKQQLYREVLERNLNRHRQGVETALAKYPTDIRQQLYTVADWFVSQPPMDMLRLTMSDLKSFDTQEAERLSQLALDSIIEPLARALLDAQERGEVWHEDLGLVAGGLFGMLQSLHLIPTYAITTSRQHMARQLIDVVLAGLTV